MVFLDKITHKVQLITLAEVPRAGTPHAGDPPIEYQLVRRNWGNIDHSRGIAARAA